nr:hypothetical protein [Lachnospiraceae bacterium]
MKQIKRLLITFSIFMLAGLAFIFLRARQFDDTDRDMSYYNDLLYKVYDDYNAGFPEEDIEKKYNCSIVLSKEIQDPELTELYKKGALVLDLVPDGEYIGKVAWADSQEKHDRAKKFFSTTAFILWAFVFVSGYILILSVYISLIRPVDELTEFSSEIAKGNLEVPLPRHGYGLFGNFTEAFDIMRLALKEAREREIDSEMARKEIVTKLSHDIKTPAAVIKATCEVLLLKFSRSGASEDSADTLEKLGIISAKADTIGSLMSNVISSTLSDLEEPDVHVEETDSRIIEEYFGK